MSAHFYYYLNSFFNSEPLPEGFPLTNVAERRHLSHLRAEYQNDFKQGMILETFNLKDIETVTLGIVARTVDRLINVALLNSLFTTFWLDLESPYIMPFGFHILLCQQCTHVVIEDLQTGKLSIYIFIR